MTGGLGNQMFIYAFYMKMKRLFPNTRIDLSDMMHYHVHNGYELHRIFQQLPEDEFCMPQKTKKVIEFLFFKTILERKQDLTTLRARRFRPFAWLHPCKEISSSSLRSVKRMSLPCTCNTPSLAKSISVRMALAVVILEKAARSSRVICTIRRPSRE